MCTSTVKVGSAWCCAHTAARRRRQLNPNERRHFRLLLHYFWCFNSLLYFLAGFTRTRPPWPPFETSPSPSSPTGGTWWSIQSGRSVIENKFVDLRLFINFHAGAIRISQLKKIKIFSSLIFMSWWRHRFKVVVNEKELRVSSGEINRIVKTISSLSCVSGCQTHEITTFSRHETRHFYHSVKVTTVSWSDVSLKSKGEQNGAIF